MMEHTFGEIEARIIGCLIEKEATTPEYYPLTVNALKAACNQKSNREPVMSLDEGTIIRGLDALRRLGFIWRKSTPGSRTEKFEHSLSGVYPFSADEIAVICVLLLRGPQTVGEIRTRTARIHEFADTSQVQLVLDSLSARDDGPFVMELPIQPGRREPRFAHLFCGEVDIEELDSGNAEPARGLTSVSDQRIEALENQVAVLQHELSGLQQSFLEFKKEFE